MKKITASISIFLFFSAVDFLYSEVTEDLPTFALTVFKGGRSFSLEEVDLVSSQTKWSEHQKTILRTQMMASVDDSARYEKAIEIASEYIESGSVEWAREYLRMQRGFVYNLMGNRETGNAELESLVNSNAFRGLESIDDPMLDSIKSQQKNLSAYLNDVMRQSIGHYYMDFRKAGSDSEKAFFYFDGIASHGLREKCMTQLKDRMGGAFDELDEGRIRSRYVPKGLQNGHKNSEALEKVSVVGSREKKRSAGSSSEARDSEKSSGIIHIYWYIIGISAILIGYIRLRLLRTRKV